MLTAANNCCLIVVDIQERLLPAISAPNRVVANSRILVAAAKALGVPVVASEQHPRGLGPTVPAVAEALPTDAVMEKIHFSCLRDEAMRRRIAGLNRRQAVVVGIEAHVCVLQTVDDLLGAGYEVFVVADATASRTELSHATAMARLAQTGASVVTTEMVVFEWLERAGTPVFKALTALIK